MTLWYLASIFIITEQMDSDQIADAFQRVMGVGDCVVWESKDSSINFCKE